MPIIHTYTILCEIYNNNMYDNCLVFLINGKGK